MEFHSVKNVFLQRIRESAGKLRALSPSTGIDLMLAFYKEVRARGCPVEKDGDMLLFQYGTYDWKMGEGDFFEFDITRQLIRGTADDDNMFQLRLVFKFKPTRSLRKLQGGRWC